MKQDIKSLLPEELKRQLVELGEKPFRARQIFTWLHRGVTDFDQMTDLSKSLRQKLGYHGELIRTVRNVGYKMG